MKRVLLVFVLAGATLAVGAGSAGATNECRGLQVCLRVPGPWIVVPTSQRVPRPRAEYQLSCPRGYLVGGLDAELTDRSIEVGFLGKTGSPVNPGVTTARAAVFLATYTGAAGRAPSFRPHLGCIPTSGGGAGPVPFAKTNGASATAFPPGELTTRRIRVLRLRANAGQTVVRACAAGERLISGWHAVGFYTARAPSPAMVASVAATRSVRGGRVTVSTRSGRALRGVRAVVQVGAVCGGGR